MRYRLKTTVRTQTACIVRREEEAGCFVLLTHVPTAGDLAHSARDLLTVDKDQHGTEQNYGFLKDPVIVNRLFLKKPERIEALGLVLWLALLIWRVMERSMRAYVDTSGTPLTGWDHKATERPTAFMMVTKFAGVIVVKLGDHRQLARPLSVVQQQYLTALDVAVACVTDSPSGYGDGDHCGQPLTAAPASPALVGHRPAADARQDHQQPRGTRARLAKRQGPYQSSPPDLGRAGRDDHWAFVWWDNRIPAAHSRGTAMGLAVCGKL